MSNGPQFLGPRQTPAEAAQSFQRAAQLRAAYDRMCSGTPAVQPCNCMGPQPGETKCPCQLSAEMQRGQSMIADGIVIGGRKYRLVPET